jgi:hypothetical protein
MSNSTQTTEPCCETCGTRLRIYQPTGHTPTMFCGGCESPWAVHIRPVCSLDLPEESA